MVDALDLGQRDEFDDARRARRAGARSRRGMVAELRAAGFEVAPAHLEITGDLPRGSGLSSSAALEAALALALLRRAAGRPARRWPSSARGSRTSGSGAETGLLDQIASLLSRARPRAADRLPLARRRAAPARPRRLAARHARFRRDALDRRLRLQRAPRRVPRGLRGARHRLAARRRRPERARRHAAASAPATSSARTRASTRPPQALDAHDLRRRRASCWTPRTPRCETTTRRPCPRSRPPWSA